jgi:hypothetical protein
MFINKYICILAQVKYCLFYFKHHLHQLYNTHCFVYSYHYSFQRSFYLCLGSSESRAPKTYLQILDCCNPRQQLGGKEGRRERGREEGRKKRRKVGQHKHISLHWTQKETTGDLILQLHSHMKSILEPTTQRKTQGRNLLFSPTSHGQRFGLWALFSQNFKVAHVQAPRRFPWFCEPQSEAQTFKLHLYEVSWSSGFWVSEALKWCIR